MFYEDKAKSYGYCTNTDCQVDGFPSATCPACGNPTRPVRVTDRVGGVVEGFDDGLRELPLGFFSEEFDPLFGMLPVYDTGAVRLDPAVVGALRSVYDLDVEDADAWEDMLRAVAAEYNRGLAAGREAKEQARKGAS